MRRDLTTRSIILECLHIRSTLANPDFRLIFSRQIQISGFYPDFFVQVRIGPYILFSNCK